MMQSEINWATRFNQIVEKSSDLHIPPDITFKFEDDDSEIHAHKWMMGMVSPVFNNMFFVSDTKDKHATQLLVKGTTFGAFKITKNAIYGITSMENSLKGKSVIEVFSVLDLVTRYQIPEFQKIVRDHLNSLILTDDTVLEVAAIAMEKSSTFEDESQQLLILCAKFLKSKMENMRAVLEYVADHQDDMEIVYRLLTLMKDMTLPVCANCQETCLHGANITESQFREGLIVIHNDNDWWNSKEKTWGQDMISEVLGYRVRVKSVKRNAEEYEGYSSIDMMKRGKYAFKFACK